MKIATGMQPYGGIRSAFELGDFESNQFGVKGIRGVRVRSGHNVGGSTGVRDLDHGDGLLQRFGAIIQSGEDVAVDIDHLRLCYNMLVAEAARRLIESHI